MDALIPFYIFNCEQDFEGYDTDLEKLEQLKELYRGIIERLEELVNQNEITAFDKGTILELSSDVVKELAHKYSTMTEGIGEIMSGTMIETDARKILDQGINIGISQGEARGEKKGEANGEKKKGNEIAEAMLSDGKPVEEIIKYTGVSLTTLQEIADRLGLTITITEETVEGECKSE